jgi:hypothetical protein
LQRFNERKHVDAVGVDKFDRAADLAMVRLKKDARLCAADKLRRALSYEMAIIATGGPRRPFSLESGRFGRPSQEMQDVCDFYINSTESEA